MRTHQRRPRIGDAMADLAAWDSFYVIVGSAAGALIGLQFVVVTLIAQRPIRASPEGSAAFGTPTVVHFGAALLLAALFARAVADDRRAGGTLGCCRLRRNCLHRDRVATHAQARRLRTGIRGLAVSYRVADGGLCRAGIVGLGDGSARARGPVWRRRRSVAVAFHRHPQRLGRGLLPRILQQAGYGCRSALSSADFAAK